MQVPKKEEDPWYFNAHVKVENVYVEESLCDLGAVGNLMPYVTFKKIGGLVLLRKILKNVHQHNYV